MSLYCNYGNTQHGARRAEIGNAPLGSGALYSIRHIKTKSTVTKKKKKKEKDH